MIETKRKHFIKGSVERGFPDFYKKKKKKNRPWRPDEHPCKLGFFFFIERHEKRERTPLVSRRPWALTYSRDRPYNFSCMSTKSNNGRLGCYFSRFRSHLARKSLQWSAVLVSTKKQNFEQRKQIKLLEDLRVRAYQFDFSSVVGSGFRGFCGLKIQLGVLGALWAPQRGPGQSPGKFWKWCILKAKIIELDAIFFFLCLETSVLIQASVCINLLWCLCCQAGSTNVT